VYEIIRDFIVLNFDMYVVGVQRSRSLYQLTQIVSVYVYMQSVLCSKGRVNESLYLRE
jgi:hypothetical protein